MVYGLQEVAKWGGTQRPTDRHKNLSDPIGIATVSMHRLIQTNDDSAAMLATLKNKTERTLVDVEKASERSNAN